MQRRLYLLLLASFCLGPGWLFAISPSVMADEPIQVFLLAGQSNMDGHAWASQLPTTPFNFQEPQEDVLLYFGDPAGRHNPGTPGDVVPADTLIPLQPGASSQGGFRKFGPEVTFGRAIADARPSENIALIKYAVGGSSLEWNWNPALSAAYSDFKQTVAGGLAALETEGHATRIAGMLWMQGESDVKDPKFRNSYETNLTNFIASVRTDFGGDLPFVIGQLSSSQTGNNRPVDALEVVRTAQANVARDVPGVGLVVTNDFPLGFDDLHFNMEGQMALGNAYAEQYLTLVPEPAPLPALLVGILVFVSVLPSRRRG